MIRHCLVSALIAVGSPALAEIQRADDINAAAAVSVSFNKNTGLFTYAYTVSNDRASSKSLDAIHIPLRGATIVNIRAPAGWSGSVNLAGTLMGWCVCVESGFEIPAGYVDDGRGIPSKYAVKPGSSLSGFSFQSAYPASPSVVYLGAWIPVPVEGVDFPEGEEPHVPDFPLDQLQRTVDGPERNDRLTLGGRRPAVDGFLVFTNLKDNTTYSSPVVMDILFSQNGEAVNQASFNATLNGVDVSSKFLPIDVNRRRAVFDLSTGSALKLGKNVMQTTVEGVVPGASRKATDTDKAVFLVR